MSDFIQKPGNAGQPPVINDNTPKKASVDPGATPFDQILSEKLENGTRTQDSGTPSLPEIQSPIRLPHTTTQSPQAFISQIEQSMSLLETYAQILEDPEKPLKDAYSLLELIIEQTRSLEESSTLKATDPDTDLMDIVAQLTTTAAIEKLKFDRGDYS